MEVYLETLNNDMFKSNIPVLGFDDRKLILIGIPLISLLIPFIFFGVELREYIQIAYLEYPESLLYTTIYWSFNRYLIIESRRRIPDFEKMWTRLGLVFLLVLITAPIITLIIVGVTTYLRGLLGLDDLLEPTFLQGLSSTYVLTATIVFLYEAIYFFHKYKEAILEKEQIQRAHIQGQLDNLRNQINPHFLFNSLNTLMNLIPTNSDRAMNYLSKLSKFYRYSVSTSEEPLVRLETELENVKIYVDLLKERFHNGIEIILPRSIPAQAKILPLCLQLLIENAVKHNIVSNKNPLHIQIRLSEDEQYVEVENNVQQKIQEVKSTGMGLKNIRSRIAFFTDLPLVVKEENEQFKVAVPLINKS